MTEGWVKGDAFPDYGRLKNPASHSAVREATTAVPCSQPRNDRVTWCVIRCYHLAPFQTKLALVCEDGL
jgi:hypothetical protein